VRVVLADPPAFTPTYDHELAAALARTGAEVELVTSPFRFGEVPEPDGYVRSELFYPLSSRLFRRSRLRLPLKAAEHLPGLVRLARRRADVVHLQWLAAPELDARFLRLRGAGVFTAHDLLPRRTAAKRELWRRLLARFDRIVVHSERGRDTLADLVRDVGRLRVIPHPVFSSDAPRADDGRTLLCLGVIRPYKGLDDAIAAAKLIGDARLVVAGDAAEPVERYRALANGLDVDWRLGYLPQADVDRALAEATVALFPYRPELDQSGSLLRALGAGVPAVAYDVGGVAEPVRRYGAGRVVPPGDIEALAAAAADLLGDRDALAAARAGARRARDELTWDASAAAHLELYRELAP
jgi:glycosyltransferase involved in cell wall biosynthesis